MFLCIASSARHTGYTMGRKEIIQHIESELRSGPSRTNEVSGSDEILCQQCGIPLELDGHQQGDYVVHRVPSHGETEMNSVFYCGPSCFQDAMTDLFDA